MALVLTQEGAAALWGQILGTYKLGSPWVRLFGQALQPAHTDQIAAYAAVELAVAGYAPIALKPAINWQLAALPSGGQAYYPLVQWSFTGPCTLYGYWLATQDNQYSVIAEAFSTPFVIAAGGGPFQLTLPLALTSQP